MYMYMYATTKTNKQKTKANKPLKTTTSSKPKNSYENSRDPNKPILEKMYTVRGLTIPNFKTYYKCIVIKELYIIIRTDI